MMRFKPAPQTRAVDSRTFKDLGGAGGYVHVRNDLYGPCETDPRPYQQLIREYACFA